MAGPPRKWSHHGVGSVTEWPPRKWTPDMERPPRKWSHHGVDSCYVSGLRSHWQALTEVSRRRQLRPPEVTPAERHLPVHNLTELCRHPPCRFVELLFYSG